MVWFYSTVAEKVLRARLTYIKETGTVPNCVDITPDMETGLCTATFNDVGIAMTNLVMSGPRHVFKTLYGMSITWDAKEFKVYGGDPVAATPNEEFKLDLS